MLFQSVGIMPGEIEVQVSATNKTHDCLKRFVLCKKLDGVYTVVIASINACMPKV